MNLPLKSISISINSLLDRKQPFVFYNKANSNSVKALFQKDSSLYTTKDYKEQGFVFAPFEKQQEAILMPSNESTSMDFGLPLPVDEIKRSPFIESDAAKLDYLNLVNRTIEFIRSRKADKVVISRKIDKAYTKDKVGIIYENLLRAYPNAFVYIWHHPKVGIWLGASPEKLVSIEKDAFSTVALAGTQVFKKDVIWQKKEQEEQQWVTDFITDQLIPISQHLEISKPYTDKAGHLVHIKTDLKGYLDENTTLQQLIVSLHPTPAVCGTPRNTAQNFILENENYDRKFYTGFMGELNLHQQTNLYVNLRCMELNNTLASIYVGGGITKDSISEDEWKETVNKARILGDFLV